MREIKTGSLEAGRTLYRALAKYLNRAPASFLYKMLRKKNITLNGKKADGREKLKEGDVIRLFLSDATIEKFSGGGETAYAARTFEILYEDADVLFVNKPAGLLAQKAGPDDVSLVEQIASYLSDSGALTAEESKTFRPGIANRLDRNTSGIVAAGKTVKGLQGLNRMFRDRTLHKFYRCVVAGELTEPQRLTGFLVKDGEANRVTVSGMMRGPKSVPICTEYRPVRARGGYTLLEVRLITGRPHQIRAHLAGTGHPILGDAKYGDRKINEDMRRRFGLQYQLLHAYRLEFPTNVPELPKLSGRTVAAPEPELFLSIEEGLHLR